MQYFVTSKTLKKRKKHYFNILFILVLFFILLIFTIIGFYLKRKQEIPFSRQSFYYVYAAKSKSINTLKYMQEDLKLQGGAGKIFKHDNVFYLLINVYLNEELAYNVVDENKNFYKDAGVFELKTKKIHKNNIYLIKKNEVVFEFIDYLNCSIDGVYNLLLKYLSSEISDNELASKLLLKKFDLNELYNEINNLENTNYIKIIKKFLNLNLMYYENFINNFFDSLTKNSKLCNFFIDLTILKLDLFNNLQESFN